MISPLHCNLTDRVEPASNGETCRATSKKNISCTGHTITISKPIRTIALLTFAQCCPNIEESVCQYSLEACKCIHNPQQLQWRRGNYQAASSYNSKLSAPM